MRAETYSSAVERAQKDPVFYRLVRSFMDIFERLDATPGDVHAAYMIARCEWEKRRPVSLLFDDGTLPPWAKGGHHD